MFPVDPGSADPAASSELLRLLRPVADELAGAVADPPAVAPHDWIGPAASACRELETELRARLVAALVEVDRILTLVRSAS